MISLRGDVMRIVLMSRKYACVARLLDPGVRTVLDVGCRDASLKRHLESRVRYVGIDLSPGPGVDLVCDLEKGIPFKDRAFDAVVALDTLEHTDDIWFVFNELVRTARRQLVVILPNLYHWTLRLKYLRGREMDKHRLPAEPITDRHRWLVSYRSALAFCREMARKHQFDCRPSIVFRGRRHLPADLVLNVFSPNLGAWALLCVFTFPRPVGRPDPSV